jgi:hypothetical protein
MKKTTYAEDRLDPRWQKLRLIVMARDGFECQDCGSKKTTLNVHHEYYVTGRKCWMYPTWSLSTLCTTCHKYRHDSIKNWEDDHEDGTEWGGTSWEDSIGFLGIGKMEDFENSLFNIGAEIGLHDKNSGALDWLLNAVVEQKKRDGERASVP